MTTETLDKAVELAARMGHVFIATADADKRPHLAVAGAIAVQEEGLLTVNEWFCPGTMPNLQGNPNLAVVVWDKSADTGYQITGVMERMLDIGMVDGYTPEMESKWLLPGVESQILMRVERVVAFKRARTTMRDFHERGIRP